MTPSSGALTTIESETVRYRLLEIVNDAFDECARTHVVLQRKVQKTIEFIFDPLSESMHPKIESHPKRPEVSLSLPAHDLAMLPPCAGDSLIDDVLKSSCEREEKQQLDREDVVGLRDVVMAAMVSNVCDDYTLSDRSDRKQDTPRQQKRVTFCSNPSQASRARSCFSMGPEPSGSLFLRCQGKFANASSLKELPHWIRITEQILSSDFSRTSKLHAVWGTGVSGLDDGFDTALSHLVNEGRMLAKFEHTCMLVQRKALLEKAGSNHSLHSLRFLEETRGRMVKACHYAGRKCRRAARDFPLHPGSVPRLIWDSICVAVCLYDAIFLPTAVFEFDESTQAVKDGVDLFGALFWTIDILLSFGTAYFDGYTIERDLWKIAKSYVRTWFWLDLLIVLNDWAYVVLSKGSLGALRFVKLLKTGLRGVRLLRLKKVSTHYRMALQLVHSETLLATLKIVAQTVFVAIICHYVACGWYALHEVRGSESSWVDEYIPPDATNAYIYCTCLHWALTQLLPASISVQPVTTLERVYNIFVIIVAMVMFSSFISSISVSMNHLRSCRIAAIERDGQLRKFLSQYDISKELSHAIWSFMKALRRARARVDIKPADVSALKNMPESILERVYEEAFLRALQSHPLFEFYAIVEPQCISKLCRMGLEQRYLLGSELLWHDLVVTEMLFVRRGTLMYLEACGIHVEIIVEPGQWCCEEALWSSNPRIGVPFLAGMMGCELLMVDPEVFRTVVKVHSQSTHSFVFLARYGEEFIRCFNQASHDITDEDLLFNHRQTCVALLKDVTGSFRFSQRCQARGSSSLEQ